MSQERTECIADAGRYRRHRNDLADLGHAPKTQVVVLIARIDDARVAAPLQAGAIGYVRKDAEPEILPAAVQAAARGQPLLDPCMAGSLFQELVARTRIEHDLTEREMEVLRLLAHGHTNCESAGELILGEEAVKTHVSNTLAKLHLARRIQAVIHALKQDLRPLDEIEL